MLEISELTEQILKAKTEHNVKMIRELSKDAQPIDFAEALETMESKDVLTVFRILHQENAAEVFVNFKSETQEYIIDNFNKNEVKDLIDEVFNDDLVDIIDELPSDIVVKVLESTTSERREEISNILKYEEESAGAIMSVDFIKLNLNDNIKKSIDEIKKNHNDIDDIDDLYVVDEIGILKGTLEIKTLLLNKPDTKISSIMNQKFVVATIDMDQEQVSDMFKRYDINTLPVVDQNNKLMGIITVDDAIDVIDEEASEDLQKIVGIGSPAEFEYFETSIWKMFKSRIMWLSFVLIMGTISQILLIVFMNKFGANHLDKNSRIYDGILLLIPMTIVIAAIVGSSAIQTTTMTIRSLSLNQIKKRDLLMMLRKEFITSLIIGIVLTTANVLRLMIVYAIQFKGINNDCWNAIASSSISIIVAIIFANIMSVLIPIGLKKLKLDPTLSSTPFITTFIDIVCIAIFLGISLAML